MKKISDILKKNSVYLDCTVERISSFISIIEALLKNQHYLHDKYHVLDEFSLDGVYRYNDVSILQLGIEYCIYWRDSYYQIYKILKELNEFSNDIIEWGEDEGNNYYISLGKKNIQFVRCHSRQGDENLTYIFNQIEHKEGAEMYIDIIKYMIIRYGENIKRFEEKIKWLESSYYSAKQKKEIYEDINK